MDLSFVFRRLFAHETCSVIRYTRPLHHNRLQIRHKSTTARVDRKDSYKAYEDWQHRYQFFKDGPSEESKKYPIVTSDSLRNRLTHPKRVKMLMRDFIEDSLYNPSYGYFPKQAVIFSPQSPFDFRSMRDEDDFWRALADEYNAFDDALDKSSGEPNPRRQLWHTPTELFQPYYGEAIARYMATNYKVSLYPYYDLVIYEMGAGNGTMMLNVLDYIRAAHPEVYERTSYRIIEITPQLAQKQHRALRRAESAGHTDRVTIINKSIFDWDTYVSTPCFFLALEVWDNFAHDAIRYENDSNGKATALQTRVIIDGEGEMIESHDAQIDPVAFRFLKMRESLANVMDENEKASRNFFRFRKRSMKDRLFPLPGPAGGAKRFLPGADSWSAPEFIPTRLMQFFDILNDYFPAHRLVACDFSRLDSEVEGLTAPVVQTRYDRKMIQVGTPLVHQGYFDIMFPTNFQLAEAMYRTITGKLTTVMAQEDFLTRWAFIEDTRTRRGDNPLLNWYKNAHVLLTV